MTPLGRCMAVTGVVMVLAISNAFAEMLAKVPGLGPLVLLAVILAGIAAMLWHAFCLDEAERPSDDDCRRLHPSNRRHTDN